MVSRQGRVGSVLKGTVSVLGARPRDYLAMRQGLGSSRLGSGWGDTRVIGQATCGQQVRLR